MSNGTLQTNNYLSPSEWKAISGKWIKTQTTENSTGWGLGAAAAPEQEQQLIPDSCWGHLCPLWVGGMSSHQLWEILTHGKWKLGINEDLVGLFAVLGALSVAAMKLGSGLCLFWGHISLGVFFFFFFKVCLPKTYFYKWYILFFNLHVSLISDWRFEDALILPTEGSSESGSSCNQLPRALLLCFVMGWGLGLATERNWDCWVAAQLSWSFSSLGPVHKPRLVPWVCPTPLWVWLSTRISPIISYFCSFQLKE